MTTDSTRSNEVLPPITMTVDEAARQLRTSRWYVYKLMREGELKFVVVGQSRRVTRSALLDYLDRHEGESA